MKNRVLAFAVMIMVAVNLLPTVELSASSPALPTPEGFCDNDFQKLAAFLSQGNSSLGWGRFNQQTPDSWRGITWNDATPRKVVSIDLAGDDFRGGLRGNLDVSDFTALEFLDIRWNRITALNVTNTPALEELYSAPGNDEGSFPERLAELDVSTSPSLRILDVGRSYFRDCGNNLTELDLSNNPLLEELYVGGNQLTELDLSNSPLLRFVDVSENGLTALDISNSVLLEELDVDGNRLTALDVSNFPELITLRCAGNRLTSLDVSNNPKLQELWCGINPLEEINVTNTPVLWFLGFRDTQITELDVSQSPLLSHLYIENNRLTSLDLSHNHRLMHLRVDDNQLSELILSDNPRMQSISVAGNRLTDMSAFSGFADVWESIWRLDVRRNYLDLNDSATAQIIAEIHRESFNNRAPSQSVGFAFTPQRTPPCLTNLRCGLRRCGTCRRFIAPIAPINPDCPAMNWVAISDRAGLEAIADNLGGNYYLAADIDLSGAEWTPIGDRNSPFSGTFDGQGHVIRNMTITAITATCRDVGLFGAAENGDIKNVGLESTNIDIETDDGISIWVGGIVGYTGADVSNVYNSGTVRAGGNVISRVGGIVGGTSVGFNHTSRINGNVWVTDSYNTSNVKGTRTAGGIIGSGGSSVRNSFNTGSVSVVSTRGRAVAGGIIGYSHADIINCFNSGNVSANVSAISDWATAGGIFGSSEIETGRQLVRNSYNSGNITARNAQNSERSIAGGIFGSSEWADARTIEVTASYNSGTLTAAITETVGHSANFNDFDFENVWTFVDGVNRELPVLRVFEHMYTPCECLNCADCGYFGGRFGFGRVTNSGNSPEVGDALAILRYVVGLHSPISDCVNARAAANITNPGLGSPTVRDALQILRSLVGLPSVLDTELAQFEMRRGFIAPIRLIDPDCPEMNWVAISDRAGLEAIRGNLGGNYYLAADIDLSGSDWTPIGGILGSFSGTFDGQGHVIRGMTITSADSAIATYSAPFIGVGLFAVTDDAVIQNVGLEHTKIEVSVDFGAVGSIAGRANRGRISNVYNSGEIAVISAQHHGVGNISSINVGGIVGIVSVAQVEQSRNTADVIVTGRAANPYAGGIISTVDSDLAAGALESRIYACFNSGSVTVSARHGVAAGIVGAATSASIENSRNSGNITASTAAGIFARCIDREDPKHIINSYNTGIVTGLLR
jgi:hypothetical protein